MSEQIEQPLQYISKLFDEHLTNQSCTEFDPSSSFLPLLKDYKNQIISLNEVPVQQVPKNTLVRFRCMIQDTGLGQEMFISAYEKLDPNGNSKLTCYRYTDDPIEAELNTMQNEHLNERSLVYCISPPGENNWTKEAHNVNSDPLIDGINNLEIKAPNQISAKKFPLPNRDHTCSIVKFYNDMAESVKVGQLIEVIGIRGQDMTQQQNDETELDSALDLFSDIPVLHAIAFNNLNAINSYPSLGNVTHQTPQIRAQLIDYISSVLCNDTLVAEFVLLQLLSRVTVKNRGLKIGNFTLNISGFPAHQTTEQDKKTPLLTLYNPASKAFSDVLDTLNVHTVQIPLTIDGLNNTKFTPKSINENLEAGILQLVDGTVVLVDETVLEEGQLVDAGVRNFQALNDVILNQTLTYEFPYSQYQFDTDLNVISLSTSKSMLPNHCSIHLSMNNSNENRVQPSNETLDTFRQFIHSAKYSSYDIPEQVSEYIQTRFVNERKAATESKTELPTQEELMLRMNLARLAAVSFGETSLSAERYDYVINLDKQRRARMAEQSSN
ncbi:mini-chromosome maintenance replisome factor-domain-containing protein [Thamnidium elegans]|nr:mini-chromosome maintenance replisome factor-domain-containing protein [Thamnidium elegans]